jgi:putative CocE/NonD family hydrolase
MPFSGYSLIARPNSIAGQRRYEEKIWRQQMFIDKKSQCVLCDIKTINKLILSLVLFFCVLTACAGDLTYLEKHYTKKEYRIPMRDGIKLFTVVYSPKDTTTTYPMLIRRTPYSTGAYGEDKYVKRRTKSWQHLAEEGYIFVFQDVRGRFMSEGEYVNMRPYIPNKKDNKDIDETSDTYDTIEWLVNHIPNHNNKVGLWGISYPGFYASMGAIDAHPALKAVSPQAPISNWFARDDFHHNGAFTLALGFPFFSTFGIPRTELITQWPARFKFPTPDGYQFYLDMGPLKNANKKYLHGKIPFWNQIMAHGTYDEFWKTRNILPHLRNIKPAVMVVGGWFDTENLYGALHTYQAIEQNNPGIVNILVMGPWFHGGWVRSDGSRLGDISFGAKTGEYYIKNIELPFFNYYLKDKGEFNLPEAYVFETGTNKWKTYSHWPPKNINREKLYLGQNHSLSFSSPSNTENLYHQYISDPAKPVPFTPEITTDIPRRYMVEDQRFASTRPDVLVYKSEKLKEDITIAGPITADLFVSTTGTDSDWVVKLIDVLPEDRPRIKKVVLGGYQILLRGEILRGKFRNSYEKPEPMEPGEITHIKFTMNDVNHTFQKGHRIMVQIQSSWFPLFDRNPQKFVDVYHADESDFQIAMQRVYFSSQYPSGLILNVLEHPME